ncbi:unnamed protein product [Rhodiola kirilowii]
MASTTLTLAAILCFIVSSLNLAMQVQSLSYDQDIDEDESEYILDTPFVQGGLGTRRSLATVIKNIKKGAHCTADQHNICNGVRANNGTSLLNCCKKHCRNILADMNNCGACGIKCRGFGKRCCNKKCTDILRNKNNCGKCGRKCDKGTGCGYGVCGYA